MICLSGGGSLVVANGEQSISLAVCEASQGEEKRNAKDASRIAPKMLDEDIRLSGCLFFGHAIFSSFSSL